MSRADEILPTLEEGERLPTNALFTAFRDLSRDLSINEDVDHDLVRLIFKIGGERGEGALVEKFCRVLERHNINVEIEGNTEAILDVPSAEPPRLQGKPSVERPIGTAADQLRKQDPPPATEDLGDHETERSFAYTGPSATIGKASQHSTTTTNAGLNIYNGNHRIDYHGFDGYASAADDTDQSRPSPQSLLISEGYHGASDTTVHTNEGSQLDPGIDSEKDGDFYQHHALEVVIRPELRNWRLASRLRALQSRQLHLQATKRDERELLAPALESWRRATSVRRTARLENEAMQVENDVFFDSLARRASRAWDFYLTVKAFTHWTRCAFEKAERTSVARRHILRFRCFDSWQDVTAVNMLKARKFMESKSLKLWQRRRTEIANRERISFGMFESGLARRALYRWYCEVVARLALERKTTGLKSKHFHSWAQQSSAVHDKQAVASSLAFAKLSFAMRQWRLRANEARVKLSHCLLSSHRSLQTTTIQRWQNQSILVQQQRQLEDAGRVKTARRIFAAWITRSGQNLNLLVGYQTKKHAVLTAWRLRCRLAKKQSKTDEDLKQKVLGAWFYADQERWATRMRSRRTLADAFKRLKLMAVASFSAHSTNASYADSMYRAHLARQVLQRWSAQHVQNVQMKELTTTSSSVAKRTLKVFAKRKSKEDGLQLWARRFAYYHSTTQILRVWCAKAHSALEARISSLYEQATNQRKTRLVLASLRRWKSKHAPTQQRKRQSTMLRQDADTKAATHYLEVWFMKYQRLEALKASKHDFTVRRCVGRWRLELADQLARRSYASVHWRVRLDTRCIKRWALASIQLSSRAHTLRQVQEKGKRRALRRAMARWRMNTAFKLQRRAGDSLPSLLRPWNSMGSILQRQSFNLAESDELLESEGPEEGDHFADNETMMSTPTRPISTVRSSRKLPSTTPIAPLPSQLEQHLRRQYDRTISTSMFGRSGRLNAREMPRVSFADLRRARDTKHTERPDSEC